MGFFTEFSQWLDAILASYIASNTARVAALLEPAIVGLGTLYVAIWGYLQLAGKVEEPFVEGARRTPDARADLRSLSSALAL